MLLLIQSGVFSSSMDHHGNLSRSYPSSPNPFPLSRPVTMESGDHMMSQSSIQRTVKSTVYHMISHDPISLRSTLMSSHAHFEVVTPTTIMEKLTTMSRHTHLQEDTPTTTLPQSIVMTSPPAVIIATVSMTVAPSPSTPSLFWTQTPAPSLKPTPSPRQSKKTFFNVRLVFYVVPPLLVVLLCVGVVTIVLCCKKYRR